MSRTSESGIDLAVGLPGEQIKISLVAGVTAWSIWYVVFSHRCCLSLLLYEPDIKIVRFHACHVQYNTINVATKDSTSATTTHLWNLQIEIRSQRNCLNTHIIHIGTNLVHPISWRSNHNGISNTTRVSRSTKDTDE